jgi:transposase-like protein
MTCIYCASTTRKNGLTPSGTQRYRCDNCKRSFTGTALGRPLIGDQPLTSIEQNQRHNAKKKRNLEPPKEKLE